MWFRTRDNSSQRVYADAAAATPLSKRATDELVRLLAVYGNAGALHAEGVEAKKELEKARATIAKAIGAHADEIVFTGSGTEGNNLAIQGVLRPLLLEHGELGAITCAVEHQSILEPMRAMEREGLVLTELPVSSEGFVDPKSVREAINDTTVFVSIQWVNSEVGTIEPIREIAKEIRRVRKERGESGLPLYFHTDASQALLWLRMNVESLGVDLATLDGQKVLGPKGVGALYIKRGTPIEPIFFGGSQEFNLRGGTPNVPLAGSFAVALEDAAEGVEERAQKTAEVRNFLAQEIRALLPDMIVNGPDVESGLRAANSLNVSIPRLEAEMAVISLDSLGVAASTRSACNMGDEEPSHVIKALGVPQDLAGTAIRLTLLPTATKSDTKKIAQALKETAERYRR